MLTRAPAVAAVTIVLMSAAVAVDFAQTGNNEVNVEFHAFQDTRSATIFSPTVDFSRDLNDRTNLRANLGVDAISAASASCARCHQRGAPNQREVGGVTITRKVNPFTWAVGGAFSHERFYRATTLTTSLSRDLANANAAVAAGYTFSLNQPILHPTRQVETQYQHDLFLSFTQTLSKLTIAQLGYQLERLSGYLNDPFLRADVNGVLQLGQVPDTRVRQTLTARLRQALPAASYLEADYRRYFDDWQLHSNSISVGVSHHFSPALLANLSYRRYDQTGASFYQPAYVGPTPQFFTADFRLEPFASGLYTARVVLSPDRRLPWIPPGWGLTLQYERYRADTGFEAAIGTVGMRVPLGVK